MTAEHENVQNQTITEEQAQGADTDLTESTSVSSCICFQDEPAVDLVKGTVHESVILEQGKIPKSSERRESETGQWKQWWSDGPRPWGSKLIITEIATAFVIGVIFLVVTSIIERGREERAEQLENLRFVRTAIISPNPEESRQFAGLDLSDTNLRALDLTGANLSGAELKEVDLTEADLTSADLTQANLARADLTSADLSGANLNRANLSEVELNGGSLSGANLAFADLTGADLQNTSIEDACVLHMLDLPTTYDDIDFGTSQPLWPDGYKGPLLPECDPFSF